MNAAAKAWARKKSETHSSALSLGLFTVPSGGAAEALFTCSKHLLRLILIILILPHFGRGFTVQSFGDGKSSFRPFGVPLLGLFAASC